MEKEKFFSGLWIIIGLIFGSVFTNFVYQDYLAYGGTVRSLVLNNTDLYKASISLFFIFCLKGENNMHLFIWGHIFATLDFFIQFCILYGIFLWIHVIFADRANGHQRTGSCIYEFISHFICYVITLLLLIKRNFYAQKKKKCSMNRDIPSYFVSVFGLK